MTIELLDIAERLVRHAAKHEIRLSLFGGLATACSRCAVRGACEMAQRRSDDIDFVTDSYEELRVIGVFEDLGFRLGTSAYIDCGFHMEFSAPESTGCGSSVHLYAGQPIKLSHNLFIKHSSNFEGECICLNAADLLMTKLAIHDFKKCDAMDVVAMLVKVSQNPQRFSADATRQRIAERCNSSWRTWGLRYDVLQNLRLVQRAGAEMFGGASHQACFTVMKSEVSAIHGLVAVSPGGLLWQIRNAIGTRWPWYYPTD